MESAGGLIDEPVLEMMAAATDRATVQRLMQLFIADTERRLERLDGLVSTRNLALLAREAHALKGSAASMGAAAIALGACELEERAQRGSTACAACLAELRATATRSYAPLLGWSEPRDGGS
jgi:HPt (histidine-containing phosphotransfer) domain-containing protein